MDRQICYRNRRRWIDQHHEMPQQRNLDRNVSLLASCILLLAIAASTECANVRIILPAPKSLAIRTQHRSQHDIFNKLFKLRGGDSDIGSINDDSIESDQAIASTTNNESTTSNPEQSSKTATTNENDKLYYIQQQLYLQSRSLQLRQALIQRGLHAFGHTPTTGGVTTTSGGKKISAVKRVVDWECALSTEEYPKSCLYSLDAEYGQKVIAPMLPSDDEAEEGNESTKSKKYEWITVSSLNRLYRTDPNKVETLWYDQYAILSTWFSRTQHPYSIYTHLSHNIYATMITTALNLQPAWLLSVVLLVATMTVCGIVFLPVIESCTTMFLTSSMLWSNWPTWSRFTTHAALPVQLLIVQVLFGFIQQGIQSITNHLRAILIDEECRLLQQCVPLTIIEGRSVDTAVADTVDVTTTTDRDDDDNGQEEEESDDDDE